MGLHKFFEQQVDLHPLSVALVVDQETLTYQEIDARANQLAHWLIAKGVRPGHVVGLLLPRCTELYVALLAVLKTGAAYVPVTPDYPKERIHFIFQDCEVKTILTFSTLADGLQLSLTKTLSLDALSTELLKMPCTRPGIDFSLDKTAYIIYTSGTTGKPKGVEIPQASICAYVESLQKEFKANAEDRIYQGFAITFDAALEEIWLAFSSGARLVVGVSDALRAGAGLVAFLNAHEITIFSTVPTLLSMLEGTLPHLRLLILGGEVCSIDLITRWSRPGLSIINTYGPTEAAVVATYSICDPRLPIAIGKPLPHCKIEVVDDNLQPVKPGVQGEICIGGHCLAKGYLHNRELTAQKFVNLQGENAGRFYRTGDLGFVAPTGELYFVGRMDQQIKLRGFRVELAEIETVLMEYPGVQSAVMSVQETIPGVKMLVAYLLKSIGEAPALNELVLFLKSRLPLYMVPQHFEWVETFPLLPSGKVDRKKLPSVNPAAQGFGDAFVAPQTETENTIAAVWELFFNREKISKTADFFYDLGGHSLAATRLVSLLRKKMGMESLSMLDLYQNPSIEKLAAIVDQQKQRTQQKSSRESPEGQAADAQPPPNQAPFFVDRLRYLGCALAQIGGCYLQFALKSWELLLIISVLECVNSRASSGLSFVLTAVGLAMLVPILGFMLAILSKWLLLGKVKPGNYPLWGWFYFRWWLVEKIQQIFVPLEHIRGSPLINLYCKWMGARVARSAFIGTGKLSTFDLLEVGESSSIGYHAILLGYTVEGGYLKLGTTKIGSHCFIGTRALLEMNTQMDAGASLEDLSLLRSGACIPAGKKFTGSPAKLETAASEPGDLPPLREPSSNTAAWGRWSLLLGYSFSLFLIEVVHILPAILGIYFIEQHYEHHFWQTLLLWVPLAALCYLAGYYSLTIFFSRLCSYKLKPGRFMLAGFVYFRRWWVERLLHTPEVEVMGDSLYLPAFLRACGAKIGKRVEMGEFAQVIPDLYKMENESFTASGTFVGCPRIAEGYAFFDHVQIRKRAFIGNYAVIPPGTVLDAESLIGSLSVPPAAGKVEAQTSWFGSPAVFLPLREPFNVVSEAETFYPPRSRYILRICIEFFRLLLPFSLSFGTLAGLFSGMDFLMAHYSWVLILLAYPLFYFGIVLGFGLFSIGLKWLLEGRVKSGIKPLWNSFLWRNDVFVHCYNLFLFPEIFEPLAGTPFLAPFFRLLGAKVGKRVFINSANGLAEFDLIEIGDDAVLNRSCVIQTHLFEDRIFKMAPIKIEKGCNIGAEAFVLYDTVMEAHSVLGNLSLLMKGERLPAGTAWVGIPAQYYEKKQ